MQSDFILFIFKAEFLPYPRMKMTYIFLNFITFPSKNMSEIKKNNKNLKRTVTLCFL